jgi:hypothetical protein
MTLRPRCPSASFSWTLGRLTLQCFLEYIKHEVFNSILQQVSSFKSSSPPYNFIMFTINPYAQAGWYNPENPHSINNSTWGSQSPPPPSIFGALPSTTPPSPPSTLTLVFTSFNPTILDSTVVGPKFQKYFTIVTSRSANGHPFTTFYKHDGESVAIVEWQQHPTLQIRDIAPLQPTAHWLRPGPEPRYFIFLSPISNNDIPFPVTSLWK